MTDATPPAPDPAPAPAEGAARLFEEAAAETPGRERPAPPAPATIAPLFPDLDIQSVIGAGGMGVVYRARHRRLDRLVALKLLPQELARDPRFVERFEREARMLARLDHPRIVRVHDVGQAGGHCFLVLEHVDGANLRQVMAAGRLAPAEALAIVPQICEALQYAHDQGVVHRDIKPENVLIDTKGRVKIADFGLAKLVDRPSGSTGLTATGQVMGTPQYMAPEQFRSPQDVDHRADLYSLGVVLYEMLTGELPMGRFEPPSESSGLDARIDRIVLHALERERERRYQKAEEIKTDVAGLASPAAAAAAATPAPRSDPAASDASDLLREHGDVPTWVAVGALLLGWLVFALIHAAWGGVERGTDDATSRELWKGIGGGVVFAIGVLSAIVAATRGAADAPPRHRHKLGVTLALLNASALLALLFAVATEMHEHANLRESANPVWPYPDRGVMERLDQQRDVREDWKRILRRLSEGGVSLETLEAEYAPFERSFITGDPEGFPTQREAGIGPFLLRLGSQELAGWRVQQVEEMTTSGRVRVVIASPDGQRTLRFPMRLDDGVWRLAGGFVEEGFGPR